METDYFHNPRRFPKNAEGPFYTTGYLSPKANAPNSAMVWCGDCLQCEAPELLAPLNDDNLDTYFVRQPVSEIEIERACNAARVCCVAALRYAGRDESIIKQLRNNPELCDHIIDRNGNLVMTVDNNGELLPFAQRMVDKRHADFQRENRKRNK